MRIVIPTYRRPDRQNTYKNLPSAWKKRVWFVVHKSEKHAFRWNKNLIVTTKCGAPAFRQAGLDACLADGERYVFMFDDDLSFRKRVDDWDYEENNRMTRCPQKEIGTALEEVESELESGKWFAVGLGPALHNNNIEQHPWVENTRLMRSWGCDAELLRKNNVRIDKFLFWEDFHVVLEMLKLGHACVSSSKYLTEGSTNTAGGVSEYRKAQLLRKVRDEFVAYHDPFAKAVDKKVAWPGFDGVVPDVRCQWRKAYEHGKGISGRPRRRSRK